MVFEAQEQLGSGIELEVGRAVPIILDGVAHGGFAVGRVDGQVVFVRGAIPTEEALVRITRRGRKGRFWFADVIEVRRAASERVVHPWPVAALDSEESDAVGGLDLGHVSLSGSRVWKGRVIDDLLKRVAKIEWPEVVVAAAAGDEARGGLHSRTRVQLAVDSSGRAGMRPHRSHEVVPLQELPIAVEPFDELAVFSRTWPANSKLQIALPSASDPFIAVNGEPAVKRRRGVSPRRFVRELVRAEVAGESVSREFQVAGTGFWQVHREAPALLVEAVLNAAQLGAGESAADLYAGVGLFSGFLVHQVGPAGVVTAVEADAQAVTAARRNFHSDPNVELIAADVRHLARSGQLPRADVVVLDPPRAGAGVEVVKAILATGPRRVVHVSCDPATFARDLAAYYEAGWKLELLRAFDIYPLTHHVETVATLVPAGT